MTLATHLRKIAIDPTIQLSTTQLRKLNSRFDVQLGWPEQQPIEGLLVHSKISKEFLENIPSLKWIAVRAKNTDYVPQINGVRKFGIPSLGKTAVAEHTFALISALYKNLLGSYKNIQDGQWQKGLPANRELYGKTLGIIGYGAIGKRVGEIGTAFGMEVLVAKSRSNPQPEHFSIKEVLQKSDIVSLHVTSQNNENLIDKEKLSWMKKTSILINTSRGSVLNETDLVDALNQGIIAGSGLDVFKEEPLPKKSPLFFNSKVVITPHMGFQTTETLGQMNEALVEAVLEETKGN